MPAVFASSEEPDLATRKRTAAHDWVQLVEVVQRDTATASAPAPPWYRPLSWVGFYRSRRAAEARYPELLRAHRSVQHRLIDLAVGAGPHWGVFSVARAADSHGPETSVEQTLTRLLRTTGLGDDVLSTARSTLTALPAMRVLTELDQDPEARTQAENAILALAQAPTVERDARRRLLEHLPAGRRPLAATAGDLERSRPVKLWVSEDGALPELGEVGAITLHDIGVPPGLKGHGIGTEALLELCRYADAVGKPIHGELVPPHGASDNDLHRLARWYHRAGFRQGALDPHRWRLGSRISRPPSAIARG
ncbi:hypothetical protein [Isoptericola croceus]|uniref:hypothetical protein n=1 Tax=Isoptericola croceus TaxID=3031406 RepID=UPI0023F6EFEA|nr:hypothetical protein [Isoptericola croceus]